MSRSSARKNSEPHVVIGRRKGASMLLRAMRTPSR